MCGIIGYTGRRKAAPIILDGLKKLEYRGYDSAGIATLSGGIHIKKDAGKIDEINSRMDFEGMPGNIGIGQTRWATHGMVTRENAHPHTDCLNGIAIVHNGIIENYQELKNSLNGHKFSSNTDTEIIAHLIEEEMKNGNGFIEASKIAFKKLQGNYAILAINKNDGRMIASRRGSPLVIGVGEGEYYPASDIPAFLDHTKNVIYLYDDDFAILGENFEIFNLEKDGRVKRNIDTVDWSAEQSKKGKFDHFMLKEISEQTDAIQRAIAQDEKMIEDISNEIKKAEGVFLVGCGSSYHACLTASYIFSEIAKLHVNVVLASEFKNYKHFLKDKTLVIPVSQSGETADVLEAVSIAKNHGCRIVSVVNVVGSSLHRNSYRSLLMNAGPEICVLSTKTYTSQVALLTLLAYSVAGKYENGKKELKNLYTLVYNLTSKNTREHIKELAKKLKNKEHLFTIGRGLEYSTSLEAALKIKEVSYIHAEGFAGGELKHGTIALIEKGTPCIIFTSQKHEKETLSNAMEIKSRGGKIIGIAPENNEIFDFFIKVPEVALLNSICQIIPIQILAYQLAILRGYDPDKPRNLAKSVTVK